MDSRWWLGFHVPKTEMLEDLFYDLIVLYESDDTHLALTFGASKRIYLMDFLNKPCPVFSVLL